MDGKAALQKRRRSFSCRIFPVDTENVHSVKAAHGSIKIQNFWMVILLSADDGDDNENEPDNDSEPLIIEDGSQLFEGDIRGIAPQAMKPQVGFGTSLYFAYNLRRVTVCPISKFGNRLCMRIAPCHFSTCIRRNHAYWRSEKVQQYGTPGVFRGSLDHGIRRTAQGDGRVYAQLESKIECWSSKYLSLVSLVTWFR